MILPHFYLYHLLSVASKTIGTAREDVLAAQISAPERMMFPFPIVKARLLAKISGSARQLADGQP
jgi:hypothetical protein